MQRSLAFSVILLLALAGGGCQAQHNARSRMTLEPQGRAFLELGPAVDTVRIINRGPGSVELALRDFRNRIHTTLTLGPVGLHRFSTRSTGRADVSNLSSEPATIDFELEGDEGLDFNLQKTTTNGASPDPAASAEGRDDG